MDILEKINSPFFSVERAFTIIRCIIALMFIESATSHTLNYENVLADINKIGLPFANVLLPLSIICELFCILALLTGWLYRMGLLVLIAFTIISTLMFFPFWAAEGVETTMFLQQFLKNLTIISVLLLMHSIGLRLNFRAQ